MGLLSSFQRKSAAASRAPDGQEPADAVQQARIRARRRLIGAALLLLIGIIGFPLIFETQPRPIPLDIPIEIPHKDAAAPLVMPPPRAAAEAAVQPPAAVPSGAPPIASLPAAAPRSVSPRDEIITESRSDAGREIAAPAAKKALPQAPATTAAAAPAVDGARARALLDGGSQAAPGGGRFVVQVGAFAEAAAAREVRQRVERLGLKTYTQVAQTASGSRIRVRIGPFATREEADRALAKARTAGLSAVVLTP